MSLHRFYVEGFFFPPINYGGYVHAWASVSLERVDRYQRSELAVSAKTHQLALSPALSSRGTGFCVGGLQFEPPLRG